VSDVKRDHDGDAESENGCQHADKPGCVSIGDQHNQTGCRDHQCDDKADPDDAPPKAENGSPNQVLVVTESHIV
jgi:hypothetical protein